MIADLLDRLGPLLSAFALIGAELAVLVVAYAFLRWLVGFGTRRVAALARDEAAGVRLERVRRLVNRGLALLLWLGVIGIVALDAYQLFQRRDLVEVTGAWFARLPEGFWLDLAVRLARTLPLLIAAPLLVRWIRRGLHLLEKRAKAYEQLRSNDASIEAFFVRLDRLQRNLIWFAVLIVASVLLALPALVTTTLLIAAKVYLIVFAGLLVVSAIAALVASLEALGEKYSNREPYLGWYQRLAKLVPLFRRSVEYIVYVLVATLVLLQLSFIAPLAAFGPRLVQAIAIFFLARVMIEILGLLVDTALAGPAELTPAERQQRQTIIPIVKSLIRTLVLLVAFVLVLMVFDLNPLPILAGAGIVGIVVGLGAQPLINDIMTGFFIIAENMFLVGDYIETGSARGVVEAIDIRTTRIRDPDGQLHILRNGHIDEVVNFSKAYTFAVVEVGVAYDSDLGHVYRVLEETGRRFKEERPEVLAPTEVLGLKEFGESELLIRTVTRVKPGTHYQLSFVLKRMIKEAFDREGIEIPFARRVLIFKPAHPEEAPGDLDAFAPSPSQD